MYLLHYSVQLLHFSIQNTTLVEVQKTPAVNLKLKGASNSRGRESSSVDGLVAPVTPMKMTAKKVNVKKRVAIESIESPIVILDDEEVDLEGKQPAKNVVAKGKYIFIYFSC